MWNCPLKPYLKAWVYEPFDCCKLNVDVLKHAIKHLRIWDITDNPARMSTQEE